MAKAPAFQFYPERWLGGTAHLSPAARGIYIDLLSWSWANDRPLPVSEQARCQIARVSSLTAFTALWDEIADKWRLGSDGYSNAMLERTRGELEAFREAQRRKGIKGAAVRWPGHKPGQSPGQCPTDGSPISDLRSPRDQDQERKSVSAALTNSATPASPTVLTFPTVGKGGQSWLMTEAHVADWSALYPGLDILAEARKALAWVGASPGRRKTTAGMSRFLVGWFNRAVDSGRMTTPAGRSTATRVGDTAAAFDESHAAMERVYERRQRETERRPKVVGDGASSGADARGNDGVSDRRG